MNDSTKHLIASEVAYFFKWFIIGVLSACPIWLLMFISSEVVEIDIIEGYWEVFAIVSIILTCLPIFMYILRFAQWVIKWK